MYFLLDAENKTDIIETDNIRIVIKRGAPSDLFCGYCGVRCNKIYVDSALNTKRNEEAINSLLKPMCQGVVFAEIIAWEISKRGQCEYFRVMCYVYNEFPL